MTKMISATLAGALLLACGPASAETAAKPAATAKPSPNAAALAAAKLTGKPAAAPAPADDGTQIACAGPFGPDSTHAKLLTTFGAGAVKIETVDGVEGETLTASVVFGADPKRRLEVMWQDETKHERPATIRFGAQATWIAPGGVHIGLPLAATEALNGKPFTLSGFEWDMGGYVTDWNGGALSKVPGGCTLSVAFLPDSNAPESARNKVMGDVSFSSAAKPMRASRPTIASIQLGYPQPEQ